MQWVPCKVNATPFGRHLLCTGPIMFILRWSPEKYNWAATWQNQQNTENPKKNTIELRHDQTNKRRAMTLIKLDIRPVWASAQFDQSLCCQHEETLGPKPTIEHKAKTLIRLGGCPGWSESSLGTHSFCRGSIYFLSQWQNLFDLFVTHCKIIIQT